MVDTAQIAVFCIFQCVCAAITVLSIDRRRLGGALRRHVDTFHLTEFEKAMHYHRTKRKFGAKKSTFLSIAALVQQNWLGHSHHNTKYSIIKQVAVTLVPLTTGGTIDSAASVLGMSKTSATVLINQVLGVLARMIKAKIGMPSNYEGAKRVRIRFESILGFSDAIGAIHRTLIRISRPAEHEG
jgi:hypothetical protein